MRVPPDPSGDEGGSLLASSPTGSLPAARFLRTVVSLNVVSPSRLHKAEVFKVLSPSPYIRPVGMVKRPYHWSLSSTADQI